jgi:hypothetical protein
MVSGVRLDDKKGSWGVCRWVGERQIRTADVVELYDTTTTARAYTGREYGGV